MKLTINEGLKRFFVETNAYNFVAFVDDEGKAYPVLYLLHGAGGDDHAVAVFAQRLAEHVLDLLGGDGAAGCLRRH